MRAGHPQCQASPVVEPEAESDLSLSDYESVWTEAEEPAERAAMEPDNDALTEQQDGFAGLDPQHGLHYDRVVLVLGKTVAGKTTLCKLLKGADLRVEECNGQMLIVDPDNHIGQDGMSTTHEPAFIVCEADGGEHEQVILCDCPGFGDTRGADAEIQQLQRLRRCAVPGTAFKALLVLEHASATAGTCVDTFVSLVQYTVRLLAGCSAFPTAVFLVVTKVPSHPCRKVNGKYVTKSDEEVKREVRVFLEGVLVSLKDDVRLARGMEEPGMQARCAELVAALLAASRLELLRCPEEAGAAVDCELLQRGRQAVLHMLRSEPLWMQMEAVAAAPSAGGRDSRPGPGLGVSLTDVARMQLDQHVSALTEGVRLHLDQLESAARAHVGALVEGMSVPKAIHVLRQGVDWTEVPEVRSGWLHVEQRLQELQGLQDAAPCDVVSPAEHLAAARRQAVADYVRHYEHFFELLLELGEWLWSYEVQSQPWRYDVRAVSRWSRGEKGDPENIKGLSVTPANLANFLEVLNEAGLQWRPLEAQGTFEDAMLQRINGLLAAALRHECSVDRRGDAVVVQGVCLVLSAVLPLLRAEGPPRLATLLALDTLFVDCSVDTVGEPFKLAVLAPRWHILPGTAVGGPFQHVINLDGKCGQPFSSAASNGADDAVRAAAESAPVAGLPLGATPGQLPPGLSGACGFNGKRGRAGKPAGSFFGVGVEFLDGYCLTVSACGGAGADGQHGGNGGSGGRGHDAEPAFFGSSSQFALGDAQSIVALLYNRRQRLFHGSPGGAGGRGGDGGRGGHGGPAGDVLIMSMTGPKAKHRPQSIGLVAADGASGQDAPGGQGGKGGKQGCDYDGKVHFAAFIPFTSYSVVEEKRQDAPQGQVGRAGCSTDEGEPRQSAVAFSDEERDAAVEAFVTAFEQDEMQEQLQFLCPERKELTERLAAHLQGWRQMFWYRHMPPQPQRTSLGLSPTAFGRMNDTLRSLTEARTEAPSAPRPPSYDEAAARFAQREKSAEPYKRFEFVFNNTKK